VTHALDMCGCMCLPSVAPIAYVGKLQQLTPALSHLLLQNLCNITLIGAKLLANSASYGGCVAVQVGSQCSAPTSITWSTMSVQCT
jgi:hypothetical protein